MHSLSLESQSKIEKEIKRMTAITVNDIYTKEVITATEDTPVQDIATIMSEKKVHLIPVVEGKKITRHNRQNRFNQGNHWQSMTKPSSVIIILKQNV